MNVERFSKKGRRSMVGNVKAKNIKKDIPIYLMMLPLLILTLVFLYFPMPGLVISFMDYNVFKGFSSPWVGLDNIRAIMDMPQFYQAVFNTLKISALNLLVVFPIPIIFAIMLNEVRQKAFKKIVQTCSYLPYFLSWIAVVGIAASLYAVGGPINDARVALGGEGTERIMYLSKQSLFLPNVILLTTWKQFGWNSVIYLATISGIDAQLYEAARVDGANKFKQCIHITIPGILPTAVMLFILQIGSVLRDNLDLVYGLQNAFIDFETISTLVYKKGISSGDYAVSTAIGFMQSGVGFLLTVIANYFSKKVNGTTLW